MPFCNFPQNNFCLCTARLTGLIMIYLQIGFLACLSYLISSAHQFAFAWLFRWNIASYHNITEIIWEWLRWEWHMCILSTELPDFQGHSHGCCFIPLLLMTLALSDFEFWHLPFQRVSQWSYEIELGRRHQKETPVHPSTRFQILKSLPTPCSQPGRICADSACGFLRMTVAVNKHQASTSLAHQSLRAPKLLWLYRTCGIWNT